jgi:hypothetical protein
VPIQLEIISARNSFLAFRSDFGINVDFEDYLEA